MAIKKTPIASINAPRPRPRMTVSPGRGNVPGQKIPTRPIAPRPVAFTPQTPTPSALPPLTAPLPVDPDYDSQVAGLDRTREATLAALTGERTRGLGAYGFTENSAGVPIFDPSNPYSKAALLKANYDRSRRTTGQSMGAGGQLYSGAFQTAQDYTNRNQAQAEDVLGRNVLEFLARNSGQAGAANTAYEEGLGQAGAARRARALDSPLYSPNTSPDTPAAPTAVPKIKTSVPFTVTKQGAQKTTGGQLIKTKKKR